MHDVGGVVFALVLAIVLSGAGALVIVYPPGAAVGAAEINRWLGVGSLMLGAIASLVFAHRVRGRMAHPLAAG